MPKCSFCGEMYEFPRGLTFVKTDGHVVYFCSSKCRKNMRMKRRKVRWVFKSSKGDAIEHVKK
ncbi:50S ribosomal protein L24e [Candidatus Pacearchaeota archaeon]|nr:50S ribosomal protein L24e [Candidatus Pacearchaeota archaeon]